MNVEFNFHPECFLVLPLLAVTSWQCDDCGETGGTSICFGWLCWELSFNFGTDEHGHE